MGGCQNYGPLLGTQSNRCRIITGTQKGTQVWQPPILSHEASPTCSMSAASAAHFAKSGVESTSARRPFDSSTRTWRFMGSYKGPFKGIHRDSIRVQGLGPTWRFMGSYSGCISPRPRVISMVTLLITPDSSMGFNKKGFGVL